MNEWISVYDSLPDMHTRVLVSSTQYGVFIAMFSGLSDMGLLYWRDSDNGYYTDVFYWMPFSEPPEQKEPEAPFRVAKISGLNGYCVQRDPGTEVLWLDDRDTALKVRDWINKVVSTCQP